MISFFLSGLRITLFQSGSITKYLFYAFGEIILVVLGILIALAINNLNEEKKQRDVALNYLENLQFDFEQNEELMNRVFESLEGNKHAIKSLAYFIDHGFVEYDGSNQFIKSLSEEELNRNLTENRNRFIPIIDTLSLIFNLNRAGFLINYDLLLPTWDEIIS